MDGIFQHHGSRCARQLNLHCFHTLCQSHAFYTVEQIEIVGIHIEIVRVDGDFPGGRIAQQKVAHAMQIGHTRLSDVDIPAIPTATKVHRSTLPLPSYPDAAIDVVMIQFTQHMCFGQMEQGIVLPPTKEWLCADFSF